MNKEYQETVSLPFCKVITSLSVEAQNCLADTTDGTSHYAVLNQLIKDTVVREATTSKRGTAIHLKPGQVDCSVNALCKQMSLGRKATEGIMKAFEQLGIIRMHRSRLVSIGDMICITSWQLHDGTVIINDILHDLSDPLAQLKERKKTRAAKAGDSKPKVDPLGEAEAPSPEDNESEPSTVSTVVSSQSMPTTDSLPVKDTLPSEDGLPSPSASASTAERPTEVKGKSADYTLDLFGDQFSSDNAVKQA